MTNIPADLLTWANEQLSAAGDDLVEKAIPLREEASFRKYFRLIRGSDSLIGVFSPPDKESNENFLFFSQFLKDNQVRVPEVICHDLKKGFMVLEDFGDRLYQFELSKKNAHSLYAAALEEMIAIQTSPANRRVAKLSYEKAFEQIVLFEEWFLKGFLGFNLQDRESDLLKESYQIILKTFFEQPQVLCHFDFESRNIMVLEDGCAGILDFQDSIIGPIFLDPVSLLKDLDRVWKPEDLEGFLSDYILKARIAGILPDVEETVMKRWFDLAGLQRQLRILGTLSRLHLRDGKSYRLVDLKQTLLYMIDASSGYKNLTELSIFLQKRILPALESNLKTNL
jgi:aminoglycoside/choline kinase family phosphotransferase|tara:strand:+ start:6934 stop:7950 length:1017 start_codon:yes stop_codon:yes gene_type:complete